MSAIVIIAEYVIICEKKLRQGMYSRSVKEASGVLGTGRQTGGKQVVC